MSYLRYFVLFFSCLSFSLLAKQKIQIIPVTPSPQPENINVTIVFPEEGVMENDSNVWMQLRVRGFSLGNVSQVPRAEELANSKLGQSVHIIIDNNIYFARTGPSLAPYDEEGNYYESMYKFKIPYPLSEGKHFIRVFPSRSFGESLKCRNCFESSYFYYKTKRDNFDVDLSSPYLTYNEPSGYLDIKERQPVLLDFYIKNCRLSQDGYKVRVTIDKKIKRKLSKWVPYYIYGLRKGKHTITLELLDKNDRVVKGDFNRVTRMFSIM